MSPSHVINFAASNWPSYHVIISRPIIGQPSCPPLSASGGIKKDRCYYPHQSRDSLSPLCKIFYYEFEKKQHYFYDSKHQPKYVLKQMEKISLDFFKTSFFVLIFRDFAFEEKLPLSNVRKKEKYLVLLLVLVTGDR